MVKRIQIAGIIALISLAIPFAAHTTNHYVWTFMGNDFGYFYYFYEYSFWSYIFSEVIFAIILLSSLMLLITPKFTKYGSLLLFTGTALSIALMGYYWLGGSVMVIPVGFLAVIVSAIIAWTARQKAGPSPIGSTAVKENGS